MRIVTGQKGNRKTGTHDLSVTPARPYKKQKTRTQDPIGTLTGPYKNRKTRIQHPSGTLAGSYKIRKTGTLVGPSGTLQKLENPHPNETLRKPKKQYIVP